MACYNRQGWIEDWYKNRRIMSGCWYSLGFCPSPSSYFQIHPEECYPLPLFPWPSTCAWLTNVYHPTWMPSRPLTFNMSLTELVILLRAVLQWMVPSSIILRSHISLPPPPLFLTPNPSFSPLPKCPSSAVPLFLPFWILHLLSGWSSSLFPGTLASTIIPTLIHPFCCSLMPKSK